MNTLTWTAFFKSQYPLVQKQWLHFKKMLIPFLLLKFSSVKE